jgi:hypothetical protein
MSRFIDFNNVASFSAHGRLVGSDSWFFEKIEENFCVHVGNTFQYVEHNARNKSEK